MKFLNFLATHKKRIAVWSFGLLLFYIVVGFLILPPIVRHVAVKVLSAQLDRQVSIEKIKINPLALSTTIRGLLIKDKDGQPFVSWDEVHINFIPRNERLTVLVLDEQPANGRGERERIYFYLFY